MNEEYTNNDPQSSDEPSAGSARQPGMSKMENIYEWIHSISSALIICVLLLVFVGREVYVEGTSMVPTLQNNDRLIISNLFYTPEPGDIVVLRTQAYSSEPLIKRVIATGGQTVDIDFEEGVVYVDGIALEEDYTNSPTNRQLGFDGEITVPEGYVFVLGDNRNASADSRHEQIGCIDVRCILGKAYLRFYPFSEFGFVT